MSAEAINGVKSIIGVRNSRANLHELAEMELKKCLLSAWIRTSITIVTASFTTSSTPMTPDSE